MVGRQIIHTPVTWGDKLSDSIVRTLGSWRYLIIQTCCVCLWIIINIGVFLRHWDPYPFILLNLLFSTQASYAAPIILMAQNRSSTKDRQRDDLEANEVNIDHTLLQDQVDMMRELCVLVYEMNAVQKVIVQKIDAFEEGSHGHE